MRLIIALAVLAGAVALALVAFRDSDYVVIGYGSWVIETSLVVFVGALAAAFALAYWLVRLLARLAGSPHAIGEWRASRRDRLAHDAFVEGLIALAERRWKAAERSLREAIVRGAPRLPCCLAAARAAQGLGNTAARERYLKMASAAEPTSRIAVAFTQAELQLAEGRREEALATLVALRTDAPGHDEVLEMTRGVLYELRDWKGLLELLPALTERRLLDAPAAERLELEALAGLLLETAAGGELNALRWRWDTVPKGKRLREEVLAVYAGLMIEHGLGVEVEPLLARALDKGWNARFVYLYGLVEGADTGEQLARAEGWLKKRESDPGLLLTLGRLCVRGRLWGKARAYLEASLAIEQRSETYRVLSDLLYELGEKNEAVESARKGLALAADEGWFLDDLRKRYGVGRARGTRPGPQLRALEARAEISPALPLAEPSRAGS